MMFKLDATVMFLDKTIEAKICLGAVNNFLIKLIVIFRLCQNTVYESVTQVIIRF